MKSKRLLLMLLVALLAPWAAMAQNTLTVCDGTDNSQYVPFEGYNADAAQHNQMIFPATDLTAMNGKVITQMVFYIDQSAGNGSNTSASRLGTWTVSLGETTATTLSGLDNTITLTQVYQGYFDCSSGTLTLPFTDGYTYHGGNLLVDLNHAAASWNRWYFLGVNQSGVTAITRGSNYQFLPKTTFTYETPATCPKPTGLTCTTYTATTATLGWTENGEATQWELEYSTDNTFAATQTTTVSNNPTTQLTGLTAEQTYYARVKADCGGGDQSDWSSVCEFKPSAALYIGDGTSTGGSTPLVGNYKSSYDQMIYTASQLQAVGINAAGSITKIGFNSSAANTIARNVKIYMGHTDKTSFSNNTDFIAYNDLTLVYDYSATGNGQWNITAGWNEFELDTPFDYDGNSNLVIAMHCGLASDYSSSSFYYTATSSNQVVYAYSDSYDPVPSTFDPSSYSGSKNTTTQLPNLKLFIEITSTPKPTHLTVSDETASSATVSWQAPSSATPTGYEYMYKVATGDWPTSWTSSQGQLSAELTGLSTNTEYNFRVRANYAEGNSDPAETTFRTKVTANQIVNTVSDPATQMTWSQFVNYWNNGAQFTSTTFTLMNDITITEMVGSSSNPFSGTFDGNGNTITANLTATDASFTAPFRVIRNATFQNLKVDGTINDGGFKFIAGFAGDCYGNNTFTNCVSDVTLNATISGDGTHGGFIARNYGGSSSSNVCTTTFNGCAFTGSLLGASTTNIGGFCGWTEYQSPNYAHTTFNNCVFAPTEVTVSATNSCTFSRMRDNNASRITVTNSYYTETVGSIQGKQVYTITGESPVTVAMSGTPTEYNVSGINAYTAGMFYNNNIYAGNGDNVSLTLSNSSTGDYQADHGTLTANGETYTLAMTANNTEISESCNAPTNLRVPAQSINAHGASIAWDNPDGKLFEYYLTVGPDYTQTSWQETTDPGMQYAIYLENPLVQNTDYRFYLRKKCGENYYSAEDYVDFHTIAGNKAPTSLAYADVDAHTATITWSGVNTNYYHQSYDLYYSTDETMPQTPVQDNLIGGITTTSQGLTGLNGQTTYYVWVRDNCGTDGYSTWAGPISFTTAISCPAPTQFAASDITNHTATLSWQGTSDSYTVQYRTVAGVNAIFSEGFENGIGNWSMVNCHSSSGINTSNHYSGNNCFYFYYRSNPPQYLVSPELTGVTEGMKLEFYYKNGSTSWPETFRIGTSTTSATTAEEIEANFTFGEEFTVSDQQWHLYSATIPAGTKYICWKLTSDDKLYLFVDDVKIGTEIPAGEWQNATVDGTTANLSGLIADRDYEATVQGDCGEVDGQSTIVSTTFTTDLPCPDPTNLQVVENSLKSDRVTLSWDSDYAEAWTVAYKAEDDAAFSEQTASENPFTLQGLTEETTYTVKVRSNCGSADGLSTGWSNEVTFTTTEACVVMDVAVNDVTHHAATVTWTGDNKDEDNPGFTVSYRTAQQIDGVEESFNTTSIPDGWTRYSGLLSNVLAGTSTLTTTTSGWSFNTKNTVFDSHAYLNIWSNYQYWLVTPRTELPNGASCSFDLALTIWSGLTPVTAGNQADDKFVVLISTDNKETWTILRQWDNAGSEYVYDNITCSATGENVSLDLSSYAGQNVHIAFYGESTVSGGDNALHIDNVTIGTPVAAGTWQTVSAANDASSATISGLTAGTKYDVKVAPNCDATLESDVLQFTTVSPNEKWFITEGNWGTASNWEPVGTPTIEQNVVLKANATIESTCVAEAKSINGTGTGTNAKTLTIKDGGKLKHLNSNVRATVEKEIRPYSTNYDEESYNNGDYFLIANPLTSNVTPDEENNHLLSGNYDLYNWSYNPNDGLEWRNYEASNFSLSSGAYGYLYANEAGATLTYTGTINSYTSYKSMYCSVASNPDNYDFPSWYLLGNPYLYDAYLATAGTNGNALPYIKMNTTGDGFENVAAGTPIEPMEGFFYQQATSSGYVYVVTSAPAVQSNAKLNMNLRSANKQLDNAILVFGGDQQLGKMTFRANSSKVYMPKDGKDYAIVSTESNVGEMPVNFKAENNGTYTLSFTTEEVSFAYLHLIDNMTGEDVDLLAGASTGSATYTFDARTTDYESRFKLVFATGNNANDDAFAFYSNGSFVINNEGEATLQVIDMNGRILKSESINGCANVNVKAAAGVYMLRLVNGNDVKVQKVVVR